MGVRVRAAAGDALFMRPEPVANYGDTAAY